MRKTIVTGSVNTQDEAIAFLEAHGATTDHCSGLTVIDLPEGAELGGGRKGWDYTVGFTGADGNPELEYVEIELAADAQETVLRLVKIPTE